MFDADRLKAMGDNFVPLNADQVIPPVAQGVPQPEQQPVEQPVEEVVVEGETVVEEPTQEELPVEEMEQEKTQEELDKEADEVIRQILGEAEQAEEEVKKQEEEITKKVEETGNADLKQELETYKLKIEDMTAKNAALNKAYKDLLDQKTNLETMNDEFTRKMQLISDNPLLQDLMRGMYLQGRDPSAVTNIDATLKQLLKEYSDIDVDTLVGQARGNGARGLAPTDQSSLIGTNQAYKGLFGEGDVVPLG